MSTAERRDEGLRRVSRLTRWLAAAGVVCVGAFAGLLARPQASAKVTTTADDTAATTSNGATTPTTNAPSSSKTPGTRVSPPTQPPVRSRQRTPAVSGGS